jgi:hypothetical protein
MDFWYPLVFYKKISFFIKKNLLKFKIYDQFFVFSLKLVSTVHGERKIFSKTDGFLSGWLTLQLHGYEFVGIP